MLVPPGFIESAAQEIEQRGLDFLIPHTFIDYLSETDTQPVFAGLDDPSTCTPVNTLSPAMSMIDGGAGLIRTHFLRADGGIPDGFMGWGCKDNAWLHKAHILGRYGRSALPGPRLIHLHHKDSGSEGLSVREHNPRAIA